MPRIHSRRISIIRVSLAPSRARDRRRSRPDPGPRARRHVGDRDDSRAFLRHCRLARSAAGKTHSCDYRRAVRRGRAGNLRRPLRANAGSPARADSGSARTGPPIVDSQRKNGIYAPDPQAYCAGVAVAIKASRRVALSGAAIRLFPRASRAPQDLAVGGAFASVTVSSRADYRLRAQRLVFRCCASPLHRDADRRRNRAEEHRRRLRRPIALSVARYCGIGRHRRARF